MRKLLAALGLIIVTVVTPAPAQAQYVGFGPFWVDAPYVHLEWRPSGAWYIRAPFVNLTTPTYSLYYYCPPGTTYYSPPIVPSVPRTPVTTEPVAEVNFASLNELARYWNGRVGADLERFPDGDVWKSKLRIAEIGELLNRNRSGAVTEDARLTLLAITQEHAEIVRTSAAGAAQLLSLHKLDAALAEYLTSPEVRLRESLRRYAAELRRELRPFATGDTWVDYLRLTPGALLGADQPASAQFTAAAVDELLTRFDAVVTKGEYTAITSLPGFQATHRTLREYASILSPLTIRGENLPTPKPN